MGGAFLIYKVITAGLLFFLLKSVFTKHLINKYSILIGLVVIFFTSGLGWFSDSILGWDLTAPELNFFMSISTEFYLPLALLVYIFAFNKTLHLASSFNFFSLKDSILLGVALLFLGIVYIYSLVILSGFILLIIAINYLKTRDLSFSITCSSLLRLDIFVCYKQCK